MGVHLKVNLINHGVCTTRLCNTTFVLTVFAVVRDKNRQETSHAYFVRLEEKGRSNAQSFFKIIVQLNFFYHDKTGKKQHIAAVKKYCFKVKRHENKK